MKGCVLLGTDRPTQNPNFQMACSQGFQYQGPELRGAPKVPWGRGPRPPPHLQEQPLHSPSGIHPWVLSPDLETKLFLFLTRSNWTPAFCLHFVSNVWWSGWRPTPRLTSGGRREHSRRPGQVPRGRCHAGGGGAGQPVEAAGVTLKGKPRLSGQLQGVRDPGQGAGDQKRAGYPRRVR